MSSQEYATFSSLEKWFEARKANGRVSGVFAAKGINTAQYIASQLDRGLDVNARNTDRMNRNYLITFAVRSGAMEMVAMPLSRGADPNIRSTGL